MKDGNPLKWKAVFCLKLKSGTGAERMLEIVAQDSWDHVRKDYIKEKSNVDGRDYEIYGKFHRKESVISN